MNNLILSLLAVLILSGNTWADGIGFTPTPANRSLVSGIETTGRARGPVFQIFDGNGNLLLSRFVLNRDFTDFCSKNEFDNRRDDNSRGPGDCRFNARTDISSLRFSWKFIADTICT
jgi:hypothetical protein